MTSCEFAPIALFAWRRPKHVKQVLDSLRVNPEAAHSDLHVFVDGPKTAADSALINEVVAVVSAAQGFRSVSVTVNPANLGLSQSITSGVSIILEHSDAVIVVEDDILVAPDFLRFMNDHLSLYEGDPLVASIHAYVYPHETALPPTFFIRGADCWGWATWQRAWQHYRSDGSQLLQELKSRHLVEDFDLGGPAPFSQMLRDQIAGRNDSWAIRWHASTFLDGMLTLYPNVPFAANVGQDGTGSNRAASSGFDVRLASVPLVPERIELIECPEAISAFSTFFRTQSRLGGGRLEAVVRRLLLPLWRLLPARLRAKLS